MAVYALGTKLRLLQDFTTDPNLLKDAVKNLKGKNSPVLNNPAGGPDITGISGLAQESMPQQMLQQVLEFQKEETAMQTELRVRLTLGNGCPRRTLPVRRPQPSGLHTTAETFWSIPSGISSHS